MKPVTSSSEESDISFAMLSGQLSVLLDPRATPLRSFLAGSCVLWPLCSLVLKLVLPVTNGRF